MSSTSPFSISNSFVKIHETLESSDGNALPSEINIKAATASIHANLPATGLGDDATLHHLLQDISPGFSGQKTSANYYGFVTGGILPIAEVADNVVTAWDQNVQVHLPTHSVSTAVEDRALGMLLELLDLPEQDWRGRTFTTGATGANVLGLAIGREAIITMKLKANSTNDARAVAELGVLEACRRAAVTEFQVLTTMGHSSLSKAASIVGLGRAAVKDVGFSGSPWKFDFDVLESRLRGPGTASIVAVSCGEVNTGRFAISGLKEMERLRVLCDKYGAWLHVDGAFGLFSRSLPPIPEFDLLRQACDGLELADSITGDAHKCLNVPYDCGFFFTRHPEFQTTTFLNPNAAYLAASTTSSITSPLNLGLENSRRFRALPVYAVLISHGRSGLISFFASQVRLARAIAAFIDAHPALELLPPRSTTASNYEETGIIVLFRARDAARNVGLLQRMNSSGRLYISGTSWLGSPACRFAISTWKVDVEQDLVLVKEVLEEALLA